MEFQIEQNYGDGCLGWLYFEAEENTSIESLKKIAVNEVIKEWDKVNSTLYFSEPDPPRPTIKVVQIFNNKKLKNGISFKTKWR